MMNLGKPGLSRLLWLLCFPFTVQASGITILDAGPQTTWRAFIADNGTIRGYETFRNGEWMRIPFRTDDKSGPAWENVALSQPVSGIPVFTADQNGIAYRLAYRAEKDHLVVTAEMENRTDSLFVPFRSRLYLGIDAEMRSYPAWNQKFFPTLMRCEKSHFWGYFMSPEGRIAGICTSGPVASYGINYIYEGILKPKWGHQIFTGSLDLLHTGPLPARHPQRMNSLAPGERREWELHLGEIEGLETLKPALAAWGSIPAIECGRYTLSAGESTDLQLYGCTSETARVTVTAPDGSVEELSGRTFTPAKGPGEYLLTVTTSAGKQAEARVHVRREWSWYLTCARDFATRYPPLHSGAESMYGYYTIFRAERYFPTPEKSIRLTARFEDALARTWDTVAWQPRPVFRPHRIQNHTTLIGILVDLWRMSGDENYLRHASHIGDYICSEQVQSADGAYRSRNNVHYTAVIYPAKSMLELAAAEQELAPASAEWAERAQRHALSGARACADLLLRRDDIETEGDMTFEDGMITCSALQLALYALMQHEAPARNAYTAAAEYLYHKHRCLQQSEIPDARMRGGTLRYWEALDHYFAPNQVMNSPHGWTAWKIYASYYLYLLTGEENYLRDTMDTLGACVQIMDGNGWLRWGFVPDPYVRAKVFAEDPAHPGEGIPTVAIVGEQYLELITPWHRPDDDAAVMDFGQKGGQGDYTVFEIFKALEECALTQAFVIVRADGSLAAWNCTARRRGNVIEVTPAETCITGIHMNTAAPVRIRALFGNRELSARVDGMQWLGEKPACEKLNI